MDRSIAVQVVIESLREVLEFADSAENLTLDDTTTLVGQDAVLDSLGVVSLIVEVEQRLDTEHGVLVTLANDRAMSQRNSPFRTVGVLADYICELAA